MRLTQISDNGVDIDPQNFLTSGDEFLLRKYSPFRKKMAGGAFRILKRFAFWCQKQFFLGRTCAGFYSKFEQLMTRLNKFVIVSML